MSNVTTIPPKSPDLSDPNYRELPERDLDLFNKDNPRSLYNIVPDYLKLELDKIPQELLELSEHELEKKLKRKDRLSPTIDRLRIAFWMEYDRAQLNWQKMRMSSVHSAVCSKQHWCYKIIVDPEAMAWIVCPPADYIVAMREVLFQGTNVLRQIVMAKNIVDEHGNMNPKMADVALRAIEMAHIRVYGAPIIRAETRSVNVNVNQTTPPSPDDLEKLREELALLKENQDKQTNILDVSPPDITFPQRLEEIPVPAKPPKPQIIDIETPDRTGDPLIDDNLATPVTLKE